MASCPIQALVSNDSPKARSGVSLSAGVALYLQGRYVEARLHFTTMLREHREAKLTSSVQAFLAESAAQERKSEIRPIEIIEQYRTLMREDPLFHQCQTGGLANR